MLTHLVGGSVKRPCKLLLSARPLPGPVFLHISWLRCLWELKMRVVWPGCHLIPRASHSESWRPHLAAGLGAGAGGVELPLREEPVSVPGCPWTPGRGFWRPVHARGPMSVTWHLSSFLIKPDSNILVFCSGTTRLASCSVQIVSFLC